MSIYFLLMHMKRMTRFETTTLKTKYNRENKIPNFRLKTMQPEQELISLDEIEKKRFNE